MPYNFIVDSFHTGVTAEGLRAKIDRKSAISLQRGYFDLKFQVHGNRPCCVFVWYKNLDRSVHRFVTIHACDGRTDLRTDGRRTDRQNSHR